MFAEKRKGGRQTGGFSRVAAALFGGDCRPRTHDARELDSASLRGLGLAPKSLHNNRFRPAKARVDTKHLAIDVDPEVFILRLREI